MAPNSKSTIKKGKRTKKDPNAPKRALSSYMFFAKEKRGEIIAKNPEMAKDVAAVGKLIGSAWNALGEADKAPYEKLAEEDRARYEREKAEYAKKN
ncbi:high mobility group protein-like protein NHP1, putative [Babesia bigemina]|uniref:High mobility group protein-like protein NHP1, putative n=1 Tax=Babesia bigemina TaxID=5866 RepID=A0A061DEX0_BABBI|nr:high mobility group protein-like protein NHP1, putative [Babesia bigemina]CDR98015.1 high mobility group protein-like protein NHP1, putative [Babesia bigemina]|eukprot:XP_012770201.1 high mobility group protein-like protein NHP1, putative [Babesia bigemina]